VILHIVIIIHSRFWGVPS